MEFALAIRIAFTRGFDVIHACNPPDTIFLIGRFFRVFGKRFIFDHHDINPELYEAKFGRRDVWYRLLCRLERWTFATADVSIATNESYRRIAIERGHMDPAKVFVVRSGADLTRVRALPPRPELRRGKTHLVGYVGVIGKQEGLDLLLESVAYMRQRLHRNDVHFVIVGDGTELAAVRQLARELAVEDCVEFTGRCQNDIIEGLLHCGVHCRKDRVGLISKIRAEGEYEHSQGGTGVHGRGPNACPLLRRRLWSVRHHAAADDALLAFTHQHSAGDPVPDSSARAVQHRSPPHRGRDRKRRLDNHQPLQMAGLETRRAGVPPRAESTYRAGSARCGSDRSQVAYANRRKGPLGR